MRLKNALCRLEEKEREMDDRLAASALGLSEALVSGDFAGLFLLERVFCRNWRRREDVRSTLRAAREALDEGR